MMWIDYTIFSDSISTQSDKNVKIYEKRISFGICYRRSVLEYCVTNYFI